jgi:hypothetical protein
MASLHATEGHAQSFQRVSSSLTIPSGYSEMLVPAYQGQLRQLANFGPIQYPSAYYNMQFMAFRNPGTGAIYYVQTTDPDGRQIEWKVQGSGGVFTLTIATYLTSSTMPVGFVVTDNTLQASTQTAFYRTVARKYKAWAIQQKWAKKKLSPVDALETLARGQDLSNAHMSDQITPFIAGWSGRPTGCWITFWRKHWQLGGDGGVPDYRMGGVLNESLANLDYMNDSKCAPFAYTNALLWDSRNVYVASPNALQTLSNEIWDANPAARYSPNPIVKDELGAVRSYASHTDMKFVCQANSAWRSLFVDAMRNIAQDGWPGIYYDMAAMEQPKLCFDASHEHLPGDPLAWQNGIRSVLTALRSDPDTDELMIFTEGNAEIYMDLVDGFMAYGETGRPDTASPLFKQVPLFREVYGEFARTLGWQVLPVGSESTPLTSTIVRDAIKKADNFGMMFHGEPRFVGYNSSIAAQVQLRSDPSLGATFDLVNNAPIARAYELGGGAINWVVSGTAPVAANILDAETGTAAVEFGMTDRGSGAYYELPIAADDRFQLSWDMKMSASYYIRAKVAATDNSIYYVSYDPSARNFRALAGDLVQVGLGADTVDGGWRSVQRNLALDLSQATGKTIARVISLRVYGQGLIDNVTLSGTPQAFEDGTGALAWTPVGSGLSANTILDSQTGSNVIEFAGIAGRDDGEYFKRTLNDTSRFEMSWDMKTGMYYYFLVTVAADDGTWYNLLYDHQARDLRQTVDGTIKIGLGGDTRDGDWRTFRRNLADDLYVGAGKNIHQVVEVRFYGSGSIDNLSLWGNGLRSSGR